jgi:predicted DNA-binding transcriptional regulator AlpA
MESFDFTLKFSLKNPQVDAALYLEKLAEAGCDDALIGIGQKGKIALQFTRESDSAQTALLSALADVKKAIPEAELLEASPDFVGLTDVAKILGFSRQNMRKLMLKHAHEFPSPIHEGQASLWHLSKVLDWLKAKTNYAIEDNLIELSKAAMHLNVLKEVQEIDPKLQKKFSTFIF